MGGWHLRKEVTVGQIVTIIALLISGLWWVAKIDARIDKLSDHTASEDRRIEQKNDLIVKAMNGRFDRYQQTVKEALSDIKDGINRVEDKLDKKQDKVQ